jgi:aminocarboxymuconate-semialdehyde decarboxylase
MTDVSKRIEDMDRVGIDVEVVSLSTPNVFFTSADHQPSVARMINDSYAELISKHPTRFKGFASIPMDAPAAALSELHRAIDELKLNGVVLLSNIGGKPLTSPEYREFFAEANAMKLCIFLHPMLPANADSFREYVLGPIIGFPFDTSLAVARMCYDGMFEDFPTSLDHWTPRWRRSVFDGEDGQWVSRLRRLRVKIDQASECLSQTSLLRHVSFSPPHFDDGSNMVGADHMVMGSDYPHLLGSIDRSTVQLRDWRLAEKKQQIFEGTALSILNNV